MNLNYFHNMTKQCLFIELSNPSRSYLAGQVVQGRVVIENDIEDDIKEVSISLEGSAIVRWSENHSKKRHYYCASETYVSQRIRLAGDGHNLMKLPAGFFVFPFEFVLPKNIPSSFNGAFGCMYYCLKAEMNKPFLKWNRRRTLPFTVNGICDLNREPAAMISQEKKREKGSNRCACREGQIILVGKLPQRSGFVPGEIIDFKCEVTNNSNKIVKALTASLVQNVMYYAQGRSRFQRTIITQSYGPEVAIGEHELWIPNSLLIPPIPPTLLGGTCRIIDLQYTLSLNISITGLTTSMTVELPVIIGTIPLRSTFDEIRQFHFIPPIAVPLPDAYNEAKEGIEGFSSPPPSYTLVRPLTSGQVDDAALSAPFFSEYPDLPPPTYAEAVGGFTENQNLNSNEKSEKMGTLSDNDCDFDNGVSALYYEFVPNYITYRVPGKR